MPAAAEWVRLLDDAPSDHPMTRAPRRLARRLAPVLLLAAFAPLPASAELVVLEGGRFLKAARYEVRGERVRVELWRGGSLVLPLGRVERIVDDEVIPVPEALPATPALAAALAWSFTEGQPVPVVPFGPLIYDTARKHGVNPDLVAALVRAESAFDPAAVSHKGARGLMQLMPATARRFGVTPVESFDPRRNLEAGTRYLAWLLARFEGDVPRALAAYNAGEGTVDRYGGVPPYRETRTYIRRIYSTLGLAESVAALL